MNGNYNCIYCGKPVTMIGFKNYNIISSGKDKTLQVFHPDCFKKNKGRKIKKMIPKFKVGDTAYITIDNCDIMQVVIKNVNEATYVKENISYDVKIDRLIKTSLSKSSLYPNLYLEEPENKLFKTEIDAYNYILQQTNKVEDNK